MLYKRGKGARHSLKTKLLWAAVLAGAFILGSVVSVAALLHLNKSYSLTGIARQSAAERPNSGRRAPTLVANSATTAKKAASSSPTSTQTLGATTTVRLTSCSVGAARSGLAAAAAPQLRKLAEYEQVCPAATARVSFFVGTPTTAAQAQDEANWVAGVLKEFAAKGVAPLVFMEPTGNGQLLDAKQYRNGAFDTGIDTLFSALKAQGITDTTLGTWVPWPEGNIPVWTSVDPGDFVANVTKTVQFQKKYFPTSKAAVLLESKTYPSVNSWSNGAYVSLLPYVQSIPAGLIDSFGLQGFAWPPTSPGEAPQLEPTVFLRVDLAAQAASAVGAHEVWFNTGTFAKSYVVSKTSPYTLSPVQRQTILNSIVAQAKSLKNQGFSVAVHIFAEDKSNVGEAIDWSYWPAGQSTSGEATGVFKTFVGDLQAAHMAFWLYDSTH